METRRFTRSATNRYVAGVAGGLAAYLKLDPVLIRLAFVILSFANGLGIIVYIGLWLLIPTEGAPTTDMSSHMRENARDMQATTTRLARQMAEVVRSTADHFATQLRAIFQKNSL